MRRTRQWQRVRLDAKHAWQERRAGEAAHANPDAAAGRLGATVSEGAAAYG